MRAAEVKVKLRAELAACGVAAPRLLQDFRCQGRKGAGIEQMTFIHDTYTNVGGAPKEARIVLTFGPCDDDTLVVATIEAWVKIIEGLNDFIGDAFK